MAPAELIMLDDEDENNKVEESIVAIVLSSGCIVEKNILRIPRNEVLNYVTNILIQLELGNV